MKNKFKDKLISRSIINGTSKCVSFSALITIEYSIQRSKQMRRTPE